MKLIGRTLIILAAALVVVGGTFAYVQSGFAGGGRDRFAERAGGFARPANPGQPGFGPSAGRGEFGRGEFGPGGRDRGPSLFGIGEIIKDLAIIGIIVAVVTTLTGALSRRRDQPPAAQE